MRTSLGLGCLLTIGCTQATERPDLPRVEVDCTPSSLQPASGVVGLSDPHTVDAGVIDLIEDSGVGWVRAEIHWSVVQPDPNGPMDFGPYDTMIEAFTERGIQVQAILTYIPPALGDDWETIAPAFEAFATASVQRYAPLGVHYWEVFNEPNLPGYGWLSDDDDAWTNLPNYVRLLGVANQVVREHDPEGFVILGGIASEQHRGLGLEETLEVIYSNDAHDCFDILAFHPYGYQNQFPEARARVADAVAPFGEGDKPVWFNEYGWTDQNSMDTAVNATAATNPMMAVFAQKDEADALFWFAAKDYSARASTPTFGLADFELNKRPSFDTFQDLVLD